MAQQTENVDFETLYRQAEGLDDDGPGGISTGTSAPAQERAAAPDREEEIATEQAPQVGQDDLAQVDLELEPEYTQEEIDEFDRQELIAQQQNLNRAVRDHQNRTGKPLIAPEVVQRQQKRMEAVREVRETTPEISDAVEQIIEERLANVTELVREEIADETAALADKQHLDTVFGAVSGADEILNDPEKYAQLQDWVDHLPGFISQRFNQVLDGGDSEAVIGLLRDYEAYPDWHEATDQYLELEGDGSAAVTTTEQEQSQEDARPQRRQTRATPPDAALAVKSGSTRSLPVGDQGGKGVTEYERWYNDPETIKLADG
jgi:hypothetical protein